ncbi:MAG TPA: tetratricopeptide repeat protein [Streptosporangiaceae bacterium]|nr:tetratricopeptide repeat protein [Streptosporangiaceae bacterium]
MTGLGKLRAAVVGLVGFAAAQEQVLLAASPPGETGGPRRWAAAPLVAHNTEFKRQQVRRLDAIASGGVPPEFGEIDHASEAVYRGYAAQAADRVAADSRRVTGQLIEGLSALSDEDLNDPSRHPWLRGRQLWLQIIVRGFWHPSGHLGEYYLAHAQPDRAIALAAHGVATARYLGAADPARGMASYNLACAQARAGRPDEAAAALGEAIRLNPDVRANAGRDPDLEILRGSGRLAAVLAG